MPLSYARGEMYPWITATHNIIKGGCWNILHGYGCKYCFVGIKEQIRKHYDGPLILHEKELEVQYKPGNYYFIGSATDMWHPKVFDDDIGRILSNCDLWQRQCPASLEKPRFLFQSKNPGRFKKFLGEIPLGSTLATTYETDDMKVYHAMSRAPSPHSRLKQMAGLRIIAGDEYPLMLSIEPIMKPTGLEEFVDLVTQIPWSLVSIGADSCEALPMEKQPSAMYVTELAEALEDHGLKVIIKTNCVNLATNSAAEFKDLWDRNGWIYHRKVEKPKEPRQESFLIF